MFDQESDHGVAVLFERIWCTARKLDEGSNVSQKFLGVCVREVVTDCLATSQRRNLVR